MGRTCVSWENNWAPALGSVWCNQTEAGSVNHSDMQKTMKRDQPTCVGNTDHRARNC